MYEFFDRLVATALPRIRDFRGLSPRSFDGRGNYTLGIGDQTIFPEIELDKIKRQQGMDITIVTNAGNNEDALELLKLMACPSLKANPRKTPRRPNLLLNKPKLIGCPDIFYAYGKNSMD
jgi:ribosomal protein L5